MTEILIVMIVAVILILSSVAIYKSYVKRAVLAEGRALLGTIITAQKSYYVEWLSFYQRGDSWDDWTSVDRVLEIDARESAYFTAFNPGAKEGDPKTEFFAYAPIPDRAIENGKRFMRVEFNMYKGIMKNRNDDFQSLD